MIVVADTSVILNLALVGHENLLDAIFHEVVVPTEQSRIAVTAELGVRVHFLSFFPR